MYSSASKIPIICVFVALFANCGLNVSSTASGTESNATGDPAAWRRHCDALKSHPDIVRHYTFVSTTDENPVAEDVAGDAEPLIYVASETLQLVEGFFPGTKAVRLDKGHFQGKLFEVTDSGFSVEIRFRKHGQGAHLGNGRTNGMLFAQGDGYWNGLRVWTDYPSRHLRFEIGRPKPGNAFGMTASDPCPDGVWHHLTATWDRRELRLYLNGILLAAIAYGGAYSDPAAPLKIGYAGAGIGSIRMDVDEVAVFKKALPPEQILCHAFGKQDLPGNVKQAFLTATAAIAHQDWSGAGDQFENLLKIQDISVEYRAVARLALAHTLRKRKRTKEAVAQYAVLADDADTPESLREIAIRLCLPASTRIVHAAASASVYERLLKLNDLSPQDKTAIRVCLAECYLREGKAVPAREQYETVLKASELSIRDVLEVRLQIAHTHLVAKDYPAARAAYSKIASEADLPPEYRGNAALCIAHTYVREKAYTQAAAVFAKVARRPDLPSHQRWEAEQRMQEMQRLARGLAVRDPAASRVKVPPLPEPGASFYVTSDGSDDNPGTREKPFASLQRARDTIREMKSKRGLPSGGIAVFVSGGMYRARQTFELTEADSGTAEAPIVYRAIHGVTPIFSGGVRLAGFQPLTDKGILDRLPADSRDKVLQFDLKKTDNTDYGILLQRGYGFSGYPTNPWVDLYVGGRSMQLARWPNDGSVTVGEVHRGRFRGEDSGQPGEFEYKDDRPKRWTTADDIWMFGAWGHLWAGRTVRVAAIDQERRRITTEHRTSYGYREGQPYYYFNLLEELDKPGEWYLDRKTGIVYLYPPDGARDPVAQFPIHDKPFVIMRDVSHVSLRGLVFELGRAEGAVITGGTRVLLAGCTFRQLGTNGVIIQGGTDHGVLGCDIHAVGAGGLRVAGGDRKTLTPGGHFVENCHVHDFSRVDRVYAPAIHMDGVGNRIAHNLFHDSPHHGMRVEGYEHAIEYNEIHSVVYEFDDQAGIDMYGNPAYRGNVIRFNFWHHIGSGHNVAGQAGIRLDDFISAVHVYSNVFYRSAGGRFGGVQIHGGKNNVVDNNLFIDCKYALSFSPWGDARWLERLARDNTKAAVRRGGVDINAPPHCTRYPDLAHLTENPDRNFVRRNLAIDCGGFSVRDRGVNELMDNHVFVGDPAFADPAKRDFALPEDSPVYDRFGFRPIPFQEIGLYQDEFRATWPVKHDITPHYVRE
jgi:hypothetical protein